MEEFQDIQVPLSGRTGLEQAMKEAYIDTEVLQGSDQYRCEGCQQLVDAVRVSRRNVLVVSRSVLVVSRRSVLVVSRRSVLVSRRSVLVVGRSVLVVSRRSVLVVSRRSVLVVSRRSVLVGSRRSVLVVSVWAVHFTEGGRKCLRLGCPEKYPH